MLETKTVHSLLNSIQKQLKAPKNRFNSFGKYYSRSCEDILESVKPLLQEGTLIINDDVLMIGNRFYVKSTITLTLNNESISTSSYAREVDEKKGMDGAQCTGSASSYARKYALGALFAIDDTKDADTEEYSTTGENKEHGTLEKIISKIDSANNIDDLKLIYNELSSKYNGHKDKINKLVSEKKKSLEEGVK